MKKVFSSHSELAHVWAQNNQSEGRAGNMFFRDGMLYSYGDHFCIARILKSGAVVYGTHSYSLSTGKHQSLARSAASHRTMVCCSDPAASPWHNRDETEVRIKSELVVRRNPRADMSEGQGRGHAACEPVQRIPAGTAC
jgi:hypothetical protein